VRLVLVLGDQLSDGLSALREADEERDLVVMAEVMEEGTYVRHHPKKMAFCLAAMRKFASHLEGQGWRVAYSRLDDPANSQSIPGELLRKAEESGAQEVLATTPGEWRLIRRLQELPLPVRFLPDSRFLCSGAEFRAWAEGRRELRLE
jgi:deoxyribodipyrimidine photolyase-related protein